MQNTFDINDVSVVIIIGIIITFLLIYFIIYFVISYQKKHREHYEALSKAKFSYEQTLLQSQLEIQEQTFKQISQEIHDNIGQMLTLVKLHLNTLELKPSEQSIIKLEDAKDVLSKAIQDLRDLSKSLNSDTINQLGIIKAVETELKMIEKVSTIQTTCESDQTSLNINLQVELILFRIVQESLHNIIKHAKASSIIVSSTVYNGQMLLKIKDDGVGFDLNDKAIRGNGLMNIESRCRLINADLNIESGDGKGTEITLKVPVSMDLSADNQSEHV